MYEFLSVPWGGKAEINITKIAEKTGSDSSYTLSASVSKGTYILVGSSVGRGGENRPGDFTSTGDQISAIALFGGYDGQGASRTFVFIQDVAEDQDISITKLGGSGYVSAKAEIYKIL